MHFCLEIGGHIDIMFEIFKINHGHDFMEHCFAGKVIDVGRGKDLIVEYTELSPGMSVALQETRPALEKLREIPRAAQGGIGDVATVMEIQ